jgi:ribosomal protein S14
MSKGETVSSLRKEIKRVGMERAKENGKEFGECDSCGEKTVLDSELGMCGPCIWGEAETYNGNW